MPGKMMFKIHCNPKSIVTTKANSFLGDIWLQVETRMFPWRNFDDFILTNLYCWAGNFFLLEGGISLKEKFYFIDEPYFFELEHQRPRNDSYTIRLCDNTGSRVACLLEITIESKDFKRAILQAMDSVLSEARSRGWRDPNVDEIENYYNKLTK